MAIGSNNRYENLDGLKVIAAFGIVAMHVSSNMGHPLTLEIATNVIGSMTHFVKLFLILSGFGMCCGYYEKFKRGGGKSKCVLFKKICEEPAIFCIVGMY